jgi:methylmalonyl-CoA carboxyltransferase small subunit
MSEEVLAPMPGTILDVPVKVGDSIKADDELIILESMKMENPICAPSAGTVKEIKVAKGDKVSADQVLVVIE